MATSSGRQPLRGFHDHEDCCAQETAFKEKGCVVYLPKPAKSSAIWICLNGTRYQDRHAFRDKLCDLLFAQEKATGASSALLELKGGGNVDVSDVRKQLQHGADVVGDLLKGLDVTLRPVLVLTRGLKAIEARQLLRQRVSFRGKKLPIAPVRSGISIDKLH